jgi:hypothetical protein
MMHALTVVGPPLQFELPGPRLVRVGAYPVGGNEAAYEIWAVEIWRMLAAAEDSSAEIFARSKLGIAIAAMINIIATTISSSISEKPFWRRILAPQQLSVQL